MNSLTRLLILLVGLQAGVLNAQPYDPAPPMLRVMTWNVEWMFDDYLGDNRSELAREQSSPTKEFWQAKLSGVAEVIASAQPEIVALQEIEGKQTLADIASQLKSKHHQSYRYAFIEGSDSFTEQDVGLLVRGGMVSYRRHEQSKAMFDSEQFYNLSKHLAAEFRWDGLERPLTIMTVHLRATPEAEELRTRQAKLARHWLTQQLQAEEDVILLGDFNSEHAALGLKSTQAPVGEVAFIVGSLGASPLVDLLSHLPGGPQSTHLVLDKQFDRIFASPSMLVDGPGQDWVFEKIEILAESVVRGKRDGQEHWSDRLTMPTAELDLSDHLPVLATFRKK